mgnify:CR=1 FL=1
MADRSVGENETFAEFRNTMNETMTDIGDITQLGNNFGCLLYTSPSPRD